MLMQEDILIQISNKIKKPERHKKSSAGVGNKIFVSKGLISQIENNRFIPHYRF